MKTNANNIILGVACATLTGVAAFIAVKLLKKKVYVDISEACSETNNNFEDETDDEEDTLYTDFSDYEDDEFDVTKSSKVIVVSPWEEVPIEVTFKEAIKSNTKVYVTLFTSNGIGNKINSHISIYENTKDEMGTPIRTQLVEDNDSKYTTYVFNSGNKPTKKIVMYLFNTSNDYIQCNIDVAYNL